ncbi:hypothetical protein ACHAWX_000060 [Stephanocyclus meneghinianus]
MAKLLVGHGLDINPQNNHRSALLT